MMEHNGPRLLITRLNRNRKTERIGATEMPDILADYRTFAIELHPFTTSPVDALHRFYKDGMLLAVLARGLVAFNVFKIEMCGCLWRCNHRLSLQPVGKSRLR